jgi:acetolactate synthase-1/2/3 large subunit
MHGTAYANKAVTDCDMIMAIGARWDDRITGKLSEFCVGATKIHIDIDVAEFGKIVRPDVSIAADAKLAIEDLLPLVDKLDTDDWLKQIADWRKHFPLKYAKRGGLKAQHVLDRLDALGGRDCILTTDVGSTRCGPRSSADDQNGTGCRRAEQDDGLRLPGRHRRAVRQPGKRSGASRRRLPDDDVELATALLKLPADLIINNSYLGMVRQWQGCSSEPPVRRRSENRTSSSWRARTASGVAHQAAGESTAYSRRRWTGTTVDAWSRRRS